MLVARALCLLALAFGAAACGDDSAARECQLPPNAKRQVEACTAVIAADPKSSKAYNNRGVAYEMKGEFDKALADYTKAIALNPKFAVAFANRGDVHAKKGEKDKAIAEYRQALAIQPDNDVALAGLKKLGARP